MIAKPAYRDQKIEWLLILICLLLCYFPLCHNIGELCIRVWDESRNAVNALELMGNGDVWVRHYQGRPDMYELKPPLLVWLQAISMKLFGINESALRLPSMLFSMGTVLLLMRMSKIITGEIYSGIIGGLVLASINGYTRDHVARSGDHDVLLAFFAMAFILYMYIFAQSGKMKYLYWGLAVFLLGWFTKSIVIFMFLPGIFIWFVIDKKLLGLIKMRAFWLGVFGIILLMATYYWFRETRSPGYMREVWQHEWFGRYLDEGTSVTSDAFDPFYYVKGFFNRFFPFILFVFAGTIYVIADKKLLQRKFMLFLLSQFYIYLIVISLGTKNFWYDVPLFPMAALFLGLLCRGIALRIKNQAWNWGFTMVFIAGIVAPGYVKNIAHAMAQDGNKGGETESLSYFLKEENELPKKLIVLYEAHVASLYFYQRKLEGKADVTVLKLFDMHKAPLQAGDTVLMTEGVGTIVRKEYESRVLIERPGCELSVIE